MLHGSGQHTEPACAHGKKSCARIRRHACTHARTRTHARTHTHTCTCTRTRTRAHAHAHVHAHTHTHTRTNTHTHTHQLTHAHTQAATAPSRHGVLHERGVGQVPPHQPEGEVHLLHQPVDGGQVAMGCAAAGAGLAPVRLAQRHHLGRPSHHLPPGGAQGCLPLVAWLPSLCQGPCAASAARSHGGRWVGVCCLWEGISAGSTCAQLTRFRPCPHPSLARCL